MADRPPMRIQLSRAKGFRLPPGAINVARPTKWGNPYRVGADATHEWVVAQYAAAMWAPQMVNLRAKIAEELRGHDLACFCPLDQPCHADILLEIANG